MTADRTIQIEQDAIACVLIDNRALDALALRCEHFSLDQHRAIWGAIEQMHAARWPIDAATLAQQLGQRLPDVGGRAYINALSMCVPSSSNARRYGELVREHHTRREIISAAEAMIEAARSGGRPGDIINTAGERMSALQRGQSTRASRMLGEIVAERTAHYERLQAGEAVAGWPTRIPSLDSALGGGLRPGKLYFIGARPAVGKSSLSAELLLTQAEAGHPGLFLSQEMSGEEVADRAVSNRGRIEYGRLQSGKLSDADWGRAVEMLERMASLPVWVDDQPALTLADIRSKARAIPGLQVIVLDYLQLCSSGSDASSGNRNSEIEVISRGLKALAMELGLAIICLSQLNRAVEQRAGGKPMLADLRDSGSIEQDADAVLMLWPVRETDDAKTIGLSIAKNRHGRTCEFALHFEGALQRWHESAEPLYEQQTDQKRGIRR